jgi:hypothetical protein
MVSRIIRIVTSTFAPVMSGPWPVAITFGWSAAMRSTCWLNFPASAISNQGEMIRCIVEKPSSKNGLSRSPTFSVGATIGTPYASLAQWTPLLESKRPRVVGVS